MIARFLYGLFVLALCAQLSACGSGPASSSTKDGRRPPTVSVPEEQVVRAQVLADQGKELAEKGSQDEALVVFNQAIDENPQLTVAHLGIGDIYRDREVYDQADQAYRKAVVSDPNNFEARYFLGLTNQLQGKLRQAISSYERALRIDPDSYLANRDMGAAYLQSGKPDEAIPFAKKAVKANPESQPGWANLAAAYSLTGDYNKAVEAYRQTLELGEAATPVLLGLADAHIKLGNYLRAENVLRAIERAGGDPIARERMGLVLFKQRKFEAASKAYRQVLADNPKDTAALNGLGVSMMAIYLRDGEEDEQMRIDALNLWRTSLGLRSEQRVLIDLIARYTKE